MFTWQTLTLIIPLLFVTYQSLSKLLPKDTSAFLVNAFASLIGFFIMIILHLLFSQQKTLVLQPKVFVISLVIGLLIGLGNSGIIKAYNLGAPLSVFTPLFYSVTIIYGILIGFIVWHEKLNTGQILGALLSLAGIGLIIYFKK